MVIKKVFILLSVFLFAGLFLAVNGSALEFNGTVYDINGNRLANATVNVTTRSVMGFSVVAYNWTTTNESGWFNITLAENALWMYEPKIIHYNTSIANPNNITDYVGQNLPAFPVFVFNNLGSPKFYLKEAGTFNITAVNATGRVAFNYQIKDTLLGYPIAESFGAGGGVMEAIITVPADRNYSIMVFPNQSLPANFEWDNFSSGATYNLTTPGNGLNISVYNGTTKTVQKTFNITMSFPTVQGFFNLSNNIANVSGWDDMGIVAYILEPGNMIHATYGSVPYNLSSFLGGGDWYDKTNGTYNISLPATVENANYILFALGTNITNATSGGRINTTYYGGVANLTLTYGTGIVELNFTMLGMLGNLSNISIDNAADFSAKKQITTAKQSFQLINKTNSSISRAFAHIEITVNYSQWGAPQFTWMEDVPQSGNGNFSIPLLNVTGIKEMNVFIGGGNYAPRRLELSIEQILNSSYRQGGTNLNLSVYNITINSFSAGDINGQMSASNITIALYISNSTCDVPSPASSCLVAGGGTANMSNFDPMGAIIGGGKLSFRMGTGNINVHYVNVDLMASGPPEALFDSSTTDRTSGSAFDQAVRFGSGGPTIYDYVLVSIPYIETAGTGLNDSNDINMTVPLLYDDNWNVVWNTSLNGTGGTALGNNLSHYTSKQNEWNYLLGQNNCTVTISEFNASRPCYVDKTGNLVWIRLPYFSGTGPSIAGTTVAAATTAATSTSSSGGSGDASAWVTVYSLSERNLEEGYSRELKANQQVSLKIDGERHTVGVEKVESDSATVVVASELQKAILKIGESKKFEVTNDSYYDLQVTLNSIKDLKANITIKGIKEKIIEKKAEGVKEGEEEKKAGETQESEKISGEEERKKSIGAKIIIWFIIAVVVVLIILLLIKYTKKNNRFKDRVHIRTTKK